MWQDWYFATAGFAYSAVLIPSILNRKTEIPRWSSVATALTVGCSGAVYATLGFWWAAASCLYGTLTWGFLAWRRSIRVEPTGWRMLLSDEREIEVIEHYRQWRRDDQIRQQLLTEVAHDQKLAGGGCGGCPSRGGCSDAE